MSLSEYTVKIMKEYPNAWKVIYDENGEPELVNRHGQIAKGIQESDGSIVTVKSLLERLESE